MTKKLGRPDPLVVSMENVRECQSNPCLSVPCKNGATCKAVDESASEYSCICPIGFQGANCEDRLDPCDSNPCGYNEGLLCDIGPEGGHVCRCMFGGEIGSNGNTCSNGMSLRLLFKEIVLIRRIFLDLNLLLIVTYYYLLYILSNQIFFPQM